jgi:hypothetical protein
MQGVSYKLTPCVTFGIGEARESVRTHAPYVHVYLVWRLSDPRLRCPKPRGSPLIAVNTLWRASGRCLYP